MEYVIINGEFVNRTEAKIDIEDRGYQFGDGVYEVIRVYNGKMFTAKEHLERLIESGKKINMKISYSVEELKSMLTELMQRNQLTTGTIYLQVSRGIAPRNHAFPSNDVQQTFVANTRAVGRPVDNMETGVKTILLEDIRWLLCDIKSLNLLGNLMAKQKAAEAGCFEAIQHRGDTVTEGSSSNVSIIKDGKVITHPANNLILNGITRQKVLEVCRNNDIPVEERAFSLEELKQADEAFISGTTVEVTPIIEIAGEKVGNGAPGAVTKHIQELFNHAIEKECGSL
ncbi:D-amino-acid transaminase [Bacillus sp. DTU_2020_1000418_1_SI_GHA_SEK_038]|uniref:D-amino-acid transaminase n=1 Tax=Bacillus sp. DTU_2020_1000418_1_SI_GHA_SEK_038 TaxID=3077585 RepID=UPI0028EF0C91|nr:D-amino-acid transaminase [Bacillus sp. DTU_2020_1000418_1_SI_GHA_SEK_038]WNS74651.1 D-amino-acid transaminase [Bacillus sp. DTU_2020_1000418_1_SI_GHA_SEK_038]